MVPALAVACTLPTVRHPSPPQADPAPPELLLRTPLERELAPSETHAFTLPTEPGTYVRLLVRPQAMDVALRLLGQGGETVAEADGPNGSKEREMLSLVTPAGGDLRLLVERRDSGDPRKYAIELQERRAARETDEARVRAEKSFSEGLHRLALGTPVERKRARELFADSLSHWQSIDDQPGQVDCLNQLGAVAYFSRELREAVALFERALARAEPAGYLRGAGEALNNLGLATRRGGDPEASMDYSRRALEIWRQLGDTLETARTLHNIGLFLSDRGEAAPALGYLEEALDLRHRIGDVAGEAVTLQVLGTTNLKLLQTRAALEHFSRALPLSRAVGNARLEGYLLSSLAALHRQRGDAQRALHLYHEASELFSRVEDPASLANVLEALGGLYLDLGDFARAADQFQKVLPIYRDLESRDFEARLLGSIGLTMLRQGKVHEALEYYDQALELSRAIASRGTETTILHRRGVALQALGELQRSLADLQSALALEQATGSSWERARLLLDVGIVLADMGQEDAARERFGEAAELAQRSEQPAVRSAVFLEWAGLEAGRGRLEAARQMLEEALAIIESVRSGVTTRELRETYSASRDSYYDAYVDVLMRLDDAHPDEGFAGLAFAAAERGRAQSLAELLAEGRFDVRRGIADELREREILIGVRISEIQSALLDQISGADRDGAKVADLERRLHTILDERQQLETEIRMRHPRYAEVRYPRPFAVADLQKALAADTAFVEYALGSEVSYLFVVTGSDFHGFRLPASTSIEAQIDRFRTALARPERRLHGQLQASAHGLYRNLVTPAADVLRAKSRWIIAADGALHLLPFEALLTTQPASGLDLRGGAFLVREHAITYVPSAGVLIGLWADASTAGDAADEGPSFAAFADPVYGGDSGEHRGLPAIPETRREVESIAGLYPPGDAALYLGSNATEEAAKSGMLSGARRIHFAVHGHVDEVRPELSGLHLSRSRASSEDGILQAYEIFNLDLRADLVVLSACETGLGKQLAGEGLVGLSRAFLYAGTPNLVVSLWKVADASTADMMIEFYRRLNRGEDKASALRGAKLQAIGSQRLYHPFHWASFILVGGDRPAHGNAASTTAPIRTDERAAKPVATRSADP